MWEPDKSFYIRECACVGVCVYLPGITHSFQTCLSLTLLCVQKCVHVCTSECEIPLSMLKPSLAQCPLKERERGKPHTHRHKHTPVFCAHLCLHVHRHMHLCVCVSMRANLPTVFFFLDFKMFKQSVSKAIDTYTYSTQEINAKPIKKSFFKRKKQKKTKEGK